MDLVFRALNDASRRLLLDRLFERDGQTLGELCTHLPDMTRFGVMNHLSVLADANLVVTHRDGRRKLHYLNPVPIQLVHDRWISKYARPTTSALARLRHELEAVENPHDVPPGGIPMSSTPVHVYQAYIDAEPERVWNALVDGDQTVKYFYGTRIQSDLQPGSPVVYTDHSGGVVADGEVLVCDPPRRFEHTFQARWDPDLVAEGPVREAWILEEVNGATRLTVEVYDIAADSKTIADFREGFPYIVSGLKTLVETGRSLPMPG